MVFCGYASPTPDKCTPTHISGHRIEEVAASARRWRGYRSGVFAWAVFERDRPAANLPLRLLGGTMDSTVADLAAAQQLSHAFEKALAVGIQQWLGETPDDGHLAVGEFEHVGEPQDLHTSIARAMMALPASLLLEDRR